MELNIAPYKLFKRTEYSKFQVVDKSGNRIDKEIEGKIIEDYLKQLVSPGKYFEIEDEVLTRFKPNKEINCIFIPDGVRKIGIEAFLESQIEYINIPYGIEHIGREAFKECEYIEEIHMPPSIRSVSKEVFCRCSSLKHIDLSPNLEIMPAFMFSGCGLLKDVVIPDSVKYIDSFVFNYCLSLRKINLPRDFMCFGRAPFANSNIKTLTINYDINKQEDPHLSYGDFLERSEIDRLEISNNVSHIDSDFLIDTQNRIEKIDYLGNKNEFECFVKENKGFIKSLDGAMVTFKESLEDKIDEYGNRIPESIIIKDELTH